MAILRLLLVLVVMAAQQHTVMPPTVRPPTEQLREQRGAEPSLRLVVLLLRTLMWSWAFLEGSVLFALSGYCPPALARPLLHFLLLTTLTSDSTTLTSAFLAGTSLTQGRSSARIASTPSVRASPLNSVSALLILLSRTVYNGIVRYPSYAGFAAVQIGYLFYILDQQGPIVSMWAGRILTRESGGNRRQAVATGVLGCMWATGFYMVYLTLYGRMNREDAMLEKGFGEEWRVWARRVPWRLVPGVY